MRVLPSSEDPYTGDETNNWPIEASEDYAHGMRSSQAVPNALRLGGQQHHSHPAGHEYDLTHTLRRRVLRGGAGSLRFWPEHMNNHPQGRPTRSVPNSCPNAKPYSSRMENFSPTPDFSAWPIYLTGPTLTSPSSTARIIWHPTRPAETGSNQNHVFYDMLNIARHAGGFDAGISTLSFLKCFGTECGGGGVELLERKDILHRGVSEYSLTECYMLLAQI